MNANALERAIRSIGTQTEFAQRLGVSPQVVANWRKRGVPAERVVDVVRATVNEDGIPAVTPHELRPDVFPEEARAA